VKIKRFAYLTRNETVLF